MADDNHRSSTRNPSIQSTSTEFNSTMISGRSHLNELQKENRAPPPPSSISGSTPLSSVLSNTTTTLQNYQI